MNRCFKAPHLGGHLRHCAPLLLAASLTLAHVATVAQTTPGAQAQPAVRPFPAAALRGALIVTQPPNIQIDGKPERLSPGARIHGANNMLVLSSTVVGQKYLVNFVREPLGLVHEVWILTEAEARLERPLADPHPYSN